MPPSLSSSPTPYRISRVPIDSDILGLVASPPPLQYISLMWSASRSPLKESPAQGPGTLELELAYCALHQAPAQWSTELWISVGWLEKDFWAIRLLCYSSTAYQRRLWLGCTSDKMNFPIQCLFIVRSPVPGSWHLDKWLEPPNHRNLNGKWNRGHRP